MKLPDSMVNSKEIGKLKLENKVKKGIFISAKTYCLITEEENKLIMKAKGINTKSLSYNDYFSLLTKCDVKTAIRTQSIKDW